jgi:hypothetical protein
METQKIEDPPLARALFSDVRWSWIWLILRVYVGWQTAGWWGLDRYVLQHLGTPWRPTLRTPDVLIPVATPAP